MTLSLPRPLLALPLAGLLACGGGGGASQPAGPSAPAAPAGLSSSGALGRISLAWSASTGATGYQVYRSAAGGGATRITASPTPATTYDDLLPSSTADGVLYTYYVTAVSGGGESSPSTSVSNLHGTRVQSSSSGFLATTSGSPYVVDGTATIDGGDVSIPAGTMLCLRPGASLSLQDAATLVVSGTLRAFGTASAPATIGGHGFPASDPAHGIRLLVDGAASYNSSTGAGTWLDHVLLTNLSSGNGHLVFRACAPALQHCKFQSNDPQGRTYLEFAAGCGGKFTRCGFSGIVPTVEADLTTQSSFGVTQCAFISGYYAIYVGPLANNPGLGTGQFTGNTMNGARDAVLYFVTGTSNVPLSGNFWAGGAGNPPLPNVNPLGSTNTVVFAFMPALSAAPSPVGPDW